MKPSATIVTVAIFYASPCSPWVIPHDLEDGFFFVSIPHNGSSANATIFKRQAPPLVLEDLGSPPVESEMWTNMPPGVFAQPLDMSPEMIQFINDMPSRFTPIRRPAEAPPPSQAGHVPPPVSRFQCTFNVPFLSLTDWIEVRKSIYKFCDYFLVPGQTRHLAIAKKGQAAAFVCNWGKKPQECSAREFRHAEISYLDLRCGPLVPGYVFMKKWNMAYGRGFVGMDICETGLDGLKQTAWTGVNVDAPDRKESEWGIAPKPEPKRKKKKKGNCWRDQLQTCIDH